MTTLREAAQQALEALEQSETFVPYEGFGMARREAERKHQAAITVLRAALAEPVQEPVAWSYELATTMLEHGYDGWEHLITRYKPNVPEGSIRNLTPLYTTPPQRKPLTEEEIDSIWDSEKAFADIYAIVRAIERAHGIGGQQ